MPRHPAIDMANTLKENNDVLVLKKYRELTAILYEFEVKKSTLKINCAIPWTEV